MKDSPTKQVNASGGKRTGKKVCRSVRIEPAKNGGFSVSKSYRYEEASSGLGYLEDDTFAFGSKDELMAWMKKEL